MSDPLLVGGPKPSFVFPPNYSICSSPVLPEPSALFPGDPRHETSPLLDEGDDHMFGANELSTDECLEMYESVRAGPGVETPSLEVVGAFAVQVTPVAKRVKRSLEEEKAHQRVLRLERDRKRKLLCPLSDCKQIALLRQRLEIAVFERDFAVRVASEFSHDAACFHRLVSLNSYSLMHAYSCNMFLPPSFLVGFGFLAFHRAAYGPSRLF